jgi:hypothetical protein
MANDLTTTSTGDLATHERPKWLTPTETSVLADRGTILPFSAREAAAAIAPERLSELVLRYEAALMPTDPAKLAARLRALWESTTAPGNLTAKTWLHEAGRLLADLPYGIAHRAIDQAILGSDRGFTPSIAAIRAAADPMLSELRRHASRLRAAKSAQDAPASSAQADPADRGHERDQRTSAEILADVWPTMAQHDTAAPSRNCGPDPDRPCRKPNREDYLRMGVDPDVLDGLVTPAGVADQAEAA